MTRTRKEREEGSVSSSRPETSVGGIDCIRNGERMDDHIRRLPPSSTCHPFISSGLLIPYALLDFCLEEPEEYRSSPCQTLF